MPNTNLIKKDIDATGISPLPDVPDNFNSGVEKSCENCHQPISGPFCGQCGQQAESTLKYFWVVIMHLLDDIFSFDSRAARTLFPLVARPGFLTNEYFAGRRVHYVPPLRLYLFISIVFFITLNFTVLTDNNNVLNVNDNHSTIIKINRHIDILKEKQTNTKENTPENTKKLLEISNELNKFSTYLTDINKDYLVEENKNLIALTKALVTLDLERFDKGKALSKSKIERYELAMSKIAKIKRGEKVEVSKRTVSIGNNIDGSLTFDFLSEESNKKLAEFSKKLSKKAENALNSDTTPLAKEAMSKLPQLMFILLPLFAALLKIMFIFSSRLYMEHLTVALHSHSFIFFTTLLVQLLDVFYDYCETAIPSLTGVIEFIASALMIWLPIYLFIMQKRIYKQGYFLTFIKYSFIGTVYMLLIVLTGVVAFIWGLTDLA